MSPNRKLLVGGAGLAALGALYALVPTAVAQTPGVYNLEQATSGHSAYVASCAGCHRAKRCKPRRRCLLGNRSAHFAQPIADTIAAAFSLC